MGADGIFTHPQNHDAPLGIGHAAVSFPKTAGKPAPYGFEFPIGGFTYPGRLQDVVEKRHGRNAIRS